MATGRRQPKSPRGGQRGGVQRGGAQRSDGQRGGGQRGGQRSGGPRTVGQRGPRSDARRPPAKEKGLGGEQVEGRQAVREMLMANTRKVHEIWFAKDLDPAPILDDIEDLAGARRVPIERVSRRTLEERARSEAPQGVIGFGASIPEASIGDLLRPVDGVKPFLVAVDGVTDPGNLGALLRCCEGAGVTGVLLPKHRTVHVTATVAKASAGAVEHVPMALVSGLPTAIEQMRKQGIWIVGLDDKGKRTLFEIGDLAKEGICMVLGAEGTGLSRLVRERCDEVVSIPMLGHVSSLNVSAAAALSTYEVARVRMARRA